MTSALLSSHYQPPTSALQTEARTDSKVKYCYNEKLYEICDLTQNRSVKSPRPPQVDTDRNLLSDENFILPPGIESYSTDGEHLPLPPGRRRELDQHFYGELWEPDTYQHQGCERDPLSTLPLQARMQAHIHKHRSVIHQKSVV